MTAVVFTGPKTGGKAGLVKGRDSLGGMVGDFSLALSFLKGFLLIVRRLDQQTKIK